MEAKELKIGNAIWLVDKNKAYIIQDGHDIDECENNDMVKPISLTEEILLKITTRVLRSYFFGKGIEFYLVNNGCLFELKKGGILIRQIKYVHQLQNLYFDLTGKEFDVSELFNNK